MLVSITRKYLLFFLLILFGQCIFANDFRIEGRIEGIGNSKVLLQEFHGAESKVIDSTLASETGTFSFILPSGKASGQYRLIFSENRFLDLIFNKENISFSTNLEHLIDDMTVTVSAENQLYYQYLKFRVKSQKRISAIKKQFYVYDSTHAFFRELKKEYNSLISQENEFTETLIHANPGLFVEKLIRIDREPNPDPTWNSALKNQWVFDNFPIYFVFNDTALLRTNAVSAKIIAYLSVGLSLHDNPDSLSRVLNAAAFRLLAATGKNETMFRFMQHYLMFGFKRLGYIDIETGIAEIPFPCCPCDVEENLTDQTKGRNEKMPSVISMINPQGKTIKMSLRKKELYLFFNAPECKWGNLMVEQLGVRGEELLSEERLIFIYKEGEIPTLEHPLGTVYYISDKNLAKIFGNIGANQRPLLLRLNEKGEVTQIVSSWLELL
ncbi:MAG: DUF4369 domain-containing protein [Lentimicrobium sp.]|jgi:hypothetical protein|nr:DUF4369 domain-containing protein [Lentimicrobium sp.]